MPLQGHHSELDRDFWGIISGIRLIKKKKLIKTRNALPCCLRCKNTVKPFTFSCLWGQVSFLHTWCPRSFRHENSRYCINDTLNLLPSLPSNLGLALCNDRLQRGVRAWLGKAGGMRGHIKLNFHHNSVNNNYYYTFTSTRTCCVRNTSQSINLWWTFTSGVSKTSSLTMLWWGDGATLP